MGSPSKPTATFQVAEDLVAPAPEKKALKTNTDSGYHGLPEDDMDVDGLPVVPQSSAGTTNTMEMFPKSPSREQPPAVSHSEERSTTDRSFHSAREGLPEKIMTENSLKEASPNVDVEMVFKPTEHVPDEPDLDKPATEEPMDIDPMDKDLDEDLVVDESRSPSQGSSPARPLARKSSLNLAPLPPRPFTAKKSIGARASQAGYLEQSKGNMNRGSLLEHITGGKSLGGSKQSEYALEKDGDDSMDADSERPGISREESDTDSKMTKLHNKSSTQRLHDRINMLGGKSQPARPTKSITAAAATVNPSYPELPKQDFQPQLLQHIAGVASKAVALQANDDEEDDWILPPQTHFDASTRPQLHKSVSTDVMEDIVGKKTIGGGDFGHSRNEQLTRQPSPIRQQNTRDDQDGEPSVKPLVSVSQPTSPGLAGADTYGEIANEAGYSTTPIGSPSPKRYVDGPLSASKSKLQSIMKTARGLFSSSAGVSAQAKMETLTPSSMRIYQESQHPSIDVILNKKTLQETRSQSPLPNPVGRKTRSSTEKEEKRKESEAKRGGNADVESMRVREQGNEKNATRILPQTKGPLAEVAQQHAKPTRHSPRRTQIQEAATNQVDLAEEELQPQAMGLPKSNAQGQQSQSQRPKDIRRPQKPAKEAAPKARPPPVAIKVGTMSQGMRMNTALSTNLQEPLPPPQPKQPAVVKKPSNTSLHPTASNSSLKSSVSAAAKPKALIAAERKKEQVRSSEA